MNDFAAGLLVNDDGGGCGTSSRPAAVTEMVCSSERLAVGMKPATACRNAARPNRAALSGVLPILVSRN
jgi:hypothetical protein